MSITAKRIILGVFLILAAFVVAVMTVFVGLAAVGYGPENIEALDETSSALLGMVIFFLAPSAAIVFSAFVPMRERVTRSVPRRPALSPEVQWAIDRLNVPPEQRERIAEPEPEPSGYVYLMELPGTNLVKLGISVNAENRMREHARHGWSEVASWTYPSIDYARNVERRIHDYAASVQARPIDDAAKAAMPQGGYTEVMTLPKAFVISMVNGMEVRV